MDDPVRALKRNTHEQKHAESFAVLRRSVRRSDASSLQATNSEPSSTGHVPIAGPALLGLVVQSDQAKREDSPVPECLALRMQSQDILSTWLEAEGTALESRSYGTPQCRPATLRSLESLV